MNCRQVKRILIIIDDCTIINSDKLTQLLIFGRPLNSNTIYLLQKYTKVPCTIKQNSNVFVF